MITKDETGIPHGPHVPERQAQNGEETAGDEGEVQPEDGPVQYYGRSVLPQREVALHQFSFRRKSTLIAMSLLLALALIGAGIFSVRDTFDQLEQQAEDNPERFAHLAQDIMDDAWKRTVALFVGATAALMVTVFIIVRAGPRIVALEFWIRRMGAGDLTYRVRPAGNDEITELAYDLEVLRRQSVRAQRLDLAQELSDDLQNKNQELENVLGELHNTQDQVISRQKLAELGELTAGVAHEIRNPLNLIQNFARTSGEMMTELREVVEGIEGPPDQDQTGLMNELVQELSENMERIQNHGGRANRIVQDMLAMGRGTKGNFQTVDINELVEDHAMLAYHSARSHDPEFNLRIIREFDPEAGKVNLVSEDMGRVILNLVGNACYATAERSRSETGHQPTMWLSTARAEGTVEIQIKDNGNGMSEEVIEKIFNPFFTTKPTDRGTGLGLSLSNDIVREHGGTITPESEPGKYARFTVRIPAKPQDREETASM